jgi:hypothetical protein
LKAARDQVLNQYQLFPHLAKRIQSHHINNEDKTVTLIPSYKRSINTSLNRAFFKTKMAIMRLRHKME